MLDIHNPYSQPLHWKLSSVASPFVRNVSDTLVLTVMVAPDKPAISGHMYNVVFVKHSIGLYQDSLLYLYHCTGCEYLQ